MRPECVGDCSKEGRGIGGEGAGGAGGDGGGGGGWAVAMFD